MPSTESPSARSYADLAEIVLTAAREIRLRETEAKGAVSLTPSNAQIMRFVDAHPGATPSETAEATGLLRSNLSTAVRELQRLGFLEKRVDHNDGRGYRLFPTPRAEESLAALRGQWAHEVEAAMGGPDGVAEAAAVLTRLANGLARSRREAGIRARRDQL